MARRKIEIAEYESAHKHFVKTIAGELPQRGLKKLLAKVRGDGAFSRRVSKRLYGQYLAAGGEAGDWQAWIKYLLENLPAIIAALMAIFGSLLLAVVMLLGMSPAIV